MPVLKKRPPTCSLRPRRAAAMEWPCIASSLSYRLASPTKGEFRATHGQYAARAQFATLTPRATLAVNRRRQRGEATP